jgi:hypothetical protein
MPTKADYVRGMEIPKQGEDVDGFTVRNVKTSEEEIERFKRYKFTTYVQMEGQDDEKKSKLSALQKTVKKRATVFSPYGNAYICIATLRYRNSDKKEIVIEGDCRRSSK